MRARFTIGCGVLLLAVLWPVLPLAAQGPASDGSAAAGEAGAPPAEAARGTFAEALVVSASRSEEAIVDAPAAVSVVSSSSIVDAPAGDYGDLLRTIPGVNVVQSNAREYNVTSRASTGVVANTQLVLVDGRPINNAFFGNVAWENIPYNASDLAQIEVIRGPASAVWGAGALSGVINLVTKPPREVQGTSFTLGVGAFEKPKGASLGDAGSLYYGNLSHARAVSEHLAYQLSLGAFSHDAFARPAGTLNNEFHTPYPPFPNEDAVSKNANLRFDLSPEGGEQRILLAAGYAGGGGLQLSPAGPFRIEDDRNNLGYLKGDYYRGAFEGRFYANVLDSRQTGLLVRGTDGLPLESNFKTQTYTLELAHHRSVGERHLLHYGLNVSFDHFDIALAPGSSRRDSQGLYLEDEFSVSESFRAVAGLRVDRYSVLDDPVLSPRIALLFKPSRLQTIRLAYNRAYLPPNLIDNYLVLRVGNVLDLGAFDPRLAGMLFPFVTRNLGSPDLKEVSQDSYELAYVGDLGGKVTLNFAYYYSQSKNEIRNVPFFYTSLNPPAGWPLPPAILDLLVASGAGLPELLQRTNLGKVRNQGVEVGIDARPLPTLRVFANYSWQDKPRAKGLAQSLVNLPPENRFNLGGELRRERLEANVQLSYADEAFWADVLDARFFGFTDSYTLVNAGLGWWWLPGRLQTSLKVSNVLNERVQQHVFADLLSRRAIVELRLKL